MVFFSLLLKTVRQLLHPFGAFTAGKKAANRGFLGLPW